MVRSTSHISGASALIQQALADLTGTSRMTVNQVLRALEAQGAIRRGYGTIEIIDPVALRNIADA